MKAIDVMTRRVVSVTPQTPVLTAIRLMLQNRISGLPVVDASDNIVGVVTEGDFLRRAESGTERRRSRWLELLLGPGRLAEEYADTHGRKVGEVMTPDPQTIAEDTPLAGIVELMERKRIKRLPVVRDRKLVGIVSRANLLHAVASLSPKAPPSTAADSTIRGQILAELSSHIWAPLAMMNVVVREGVVDLWGTITDERQRKAVRVIAENVPGVKEVRDHLVWVEPISGLAA
jgi:CBS domain-containing protein